MNKKIEDLAKQAGLAVNFENDFVANHDVVGWVDEFATVFAKILINECIKICDEVPEDRAVGQKIQRYFDIK